MPFKYLILLVITTLVVGIDQGTKVFIDRTMDLYSTIPVIENFFNITYVRNKGAAFSFLADSSWRLPFFIMISLVAICVIIVVLIRLRPDQKFTAVSLALIFAGAVGNLIDRVRFGEVIDFLDAHWHTHHWPVFNVADTAICIGVGLLAIDMLVEEKRQKALKNK
ncbi:MAG: lipoprotein signal peptidase [Geobacter sp.]|nr:lipoprotein signal peptidase [Geobacter sp.]